MKNKKENLNEAEPNSANIDEHKRAEQDISDLKNGEKLIDSEFKKQMNGEPK